MSLLANRLPTVVLPFPDDTFDTEVLTCSPPEANYFTHRVAVGSSPLWCIECGAKAACPPVFMIMEAARTHGVGMGFEWSLLGC